MLLVNVFVVVWVFRWMFYTCDWAYAGVCPCMCLCWCVGVRVRDKVRVRVKVGVGVRVRVRGLTSVSALSSRSICITLEPGG